MEIRSLGWRTDLAILALEGSQVTDHGDHLVIRTPGNPDHWWGNFLLLRDLKPGSGDGWRARFAAEFPHAQHMALGLDETDAGTVDPGELTGMTMERNAVMTATSVHAPPHPNNFRAEGLLSAALRSVARLLSDHTSAPICQAPQMCDTVASLDVQHARQPGFTLRTRILDAV